jgi:hypothetical protein
MSVHRCYAEHPLQLDVNLLTTEFPTALADAVDRIVSETVALMVSPGRDANLLEAQAG